MAFFSVGFKMQLLEKFKGKHKIKLWIPITAGAVALISYSAIVIMYLSSKINVLGHDTNAFAWKMKFDGSEIPDYATLSESLGEFHHLHRADLGEFSISVDQLSELQELYPKTKFTCDTFVNLYGTLSDTRESTLDLSNSYIENGELLLEELVHFPNVSTVEFGDNTIPLSDRRALEETYPSVMFNAVGTVDISGVKIREDESDVRLRVTSLNVDEMMTKLSDLPELRKLSCHTAAIPLDKCEELQNRYPDIEFSIAGEFELYGKKFRDDAREIDLRDVTIDADLIQKLETFTSLSQVDLHGQPLEREQMLALSKAYPEVTFGWNIDVFGVEADSFSTELILDKHKVTDLDWLRETLTLLPRLELLQMCDCGISNEKMAQFRDEYPQMEVVWRVYLGKWSLKTNAISFSVQIYKYDYKRMTSKDIEVLKYCPHLQALDVGHQAITDLSVIGDYLPELRILILADNSVRDLTPLSKLKHLHYLELFVNRVTDLTPLASCKEMVDLNISYNYGLRDVTAIMELPMLERLWLEHTAIPSGAFKELRSVYPNTKIVSNGKGSVDQGWRTHERYYAMQDSYHNNYLSESFSKYG